MGLSPPTLLVEPDEEGSGDPALGAVLDATLGPGPVAAELAAHAGKRPTTARQNAREDSL